MNTKGEIIKSAEIKAFITKADGTIVDLGVIANTERSETEHQEKINRLKDPNGMFSKLKNRLKGIS